MSLLSRNTQRPTPVPASTVSPEAALEAARAGVGAALEQAWLAVVGYETHTGGHLVETRRALQAAAQARVYIDLVGLADTNHEDGNQ